MTRSDRNAQVADADLAPRESRLSDTILFTRKLLAKGRSIAAVTPSGETISRMMTREVEFSRPCTIVELGAGTGAITKVITSRLQQHNRFVAIELDQDFVEILRERFPNHTILRGDACDMEEPLAKLGIRKVDYVVSGMATPSLPVRSQERLHHWLRKLLDPNGKFIQITFVPRYAPRHIYHRHYARFFHTVKFSTCWRNVPPGGVFTCTNIRERVIPKRRTRVKSI